MGYLPSVLNIINAKRNLKNIVDTTALTLNKRLSEKYQCNVYLKREDLQIVRSYKIRGAYNKMSSLTSEQLAKGVVCASAGNHAQGVAYSCQVLQVDGVIYMPNTTPKQKVQQVKLFGKEKVQIVLTGDTFDEAFAAAMRDCEENNKTFIHPFDDEKVIEGQATVAFEIDQEFSKSIDYVFVPVGGGGLISGVAGYFNEVHPNTRVIGSEPEGASAMKNSLEVGEIETLSSIDKFVDGAAVQRVGNLNFEICKQLGLEIITLPEGKICTNILELYNFDAIVVEPAGAMSITMLDYYKEEIKGKNVICVLSGSNNDITRTEEIKERSLLYEGLKHYFIIRFPQRSGALKDFVGEILGPNDDITLFEYRKKTTREKGPALIGIELQNKEDFEGLVMRMKEQGFNAEYLNDNPNLFQYLI